MKHLISARWLANPNYACSHFPHDFWSSYGSPIILSKWRFLKSSTDHIGLPFLTMFNIASRMIYIFWVCGPISFQHMSLVSFLDSHPTMHHYGIGVRVRLESESGTSTSWAIRSLLTVCPHCDRPKEVEEFPSWQGFMPCMHWSEWMEP